MPAAHDIYTDQLRSLRRGQPLYYPEPSLDDGPVEIGDVGYTRQGAFCRLFNVTRSANDPAQKLGVPEGFQPLEIGRVLRYEAALEPGPLHSKTIFRVNADLETPGAILPASASFRFSCTSSRGAILMLETQMCRHQAFYDARFKNYLLQHCLAWYAFAQDLGVQVDFGDIMLVTECSKTSAWASAVYSQSSREFGMSFSAGGSFLPSLGGINASAGLERIGPVEYRRSQRRAVLMEESQEIPKDHTVFVRAYRLGSRNLYLRSISRKILRSAMLNGGDQESRSHGGSVLTQTSAGAASSAAAMKSYPPQMTDSSLSVLDTFSISVMSPDCSDFHPAVALLAHQMETTDVEIAAVHDDEWCSTYSASTSLIIDNYAHRFLSESSREKSRRGDSVLSLQVDHKSINASDEVARFELLRSQGLSIGSQNSFIKANGTRASSVILNISTISFKFPSPGLDLSLQPASTVLASPKQILHPLERRPPPELWKITLVGNGGVGKTSLGAQFAHNTFTGLEVPDPINEDFYEKTLLVSQRECCLQIFDTAHYGSDPLCDPQPAMIRRSRAVILVFSVGSRHSFDGIKVLYQRAREIALRRPQQQLLLVMVGNKADIVQDRAVSKEEGRQLAESLGCEYFETSAKTAMGVDTLFTELVRSLRRAGFTDGHRMEETRTLVREGLRVDVDERHKCIIM